MSESAPSPPPRTGARTASRLSATPAVLSVRWSS
eukprot:CAMPEP_0176167558 /NCGR_PEP_ID=MMETSP0120_2-20121206/85732_1 /TAXON_ID=160619 /ORGANISM="Kryptoperidinium foliaceum, Strain CCMP 1326" /LENGTH=33 /DNA_ID= /DNA_START= /DNA_END= /DNA_ORIENTATION=